MTATRRLSRRAFTLVELLLVLVILAVLAAVVVPRFTGRSEQAKVTRAKTDIAQIKSALRTFNTDTGRFPTNDEGLAVLLDSSNVKGAKGPYLESNNLPKDPWDKPYSYNFPGTRAVNAGYDLWSSGPDGQDNTEDDIGNWQD